MPTYAGTKDGYRNLWGQMTVHAAIKPSADKVAKAIQADRSRYEVVEARTGVPWFWIAAVHDRESGRNFKGVLHNGEAIIGTGRVTTLVPKGRGPFATWEEAAVDALKHMGLDKIDDWPLERCLYEWERYNGWGYFGKINSPYVWAGSNLYTKGKYVADGKYDPNHVDRQLGTATVLKQLIEVEPAVAEALDMSLPLPPSAPPPAPNEKIGEILDAFMEANGLQEVALVHRRQ